MNQSNDNQTTVHAHLHPWPRYKHQVFDSYSRREVFNGRHYCGKHKPIRRPKKTAHELQAEANQQKHKKLKEKRDATRLMRVQNARAFVQRQLQDSAVTEECSICLEDCVSWDSIRTPCCRHMFHKECISKIQIPQCPTCYLNPLAQLTPPPPGSPPGEPKLWDNIKDLKMGKCVLIKG